MLDFPRMPESIGQHSAPLINDPLRALCVLSLTEGTIKLIPAAFRMYVPKECIRATEEHRAYAKGETGSV